MSVVLVGLQCQPDSPSPSVSILRQMVQFQQCIPSPQSFMSSVHSQCGLPVLFFPSIYSEHHCLKFPVVTHSGNVSIPKSIIWCTLHNIFIYYVHNERDRVLWVSLRMGAYVEREGEESQQSLLHTQNKYLFMVFTFAYL